MRNVINNLHYETGNDVRVKCFLNDGRSQFPTMQHACIPNLSHDHTTSSKSIISIGEDVPVYSRNLLPHRMQDSYKLGPDFGAHAQMITGIGNHYSNDPAAAIDCGMFGCAGPGVRVAVMRCPKPEEDQPKPEMDSCSCVSESCRRQQEFYPRQGVCNRRQSDFDHGREELDPAADWDPAEGQRSGWLSEDGQPYATAEPGWSGQEEGTLRPRADDQIGG